MNMFCRKCGITINDKSLKFCFNCGADLTAVRNEKKETVITKEESVNEKSGNDDTENVVSFKEEMSKEENIAAIAAYAKELKEGSGNINVEDTADSVNNTPADDDFEITDEDDLSKYNTGQVIAFFDKVLDETEQKEEAEAKAEFTEAPCKETFKEIAKENANTMLEGEKYLDKEFETKVNTDIADDSETEESNDSRSDDIDNIIKNGLYENDDRKTVQPVVNDTDHEYYNESLEKIVNQDDDSSFKQKSSLPFVIFAILFSLAAAACICTELAAYYLNDFSFETVKSFFFDFDINYEYIYLAVYGIMLFFVIMYAGTKSHTYGIISGIIFILFGAFDAYFRGVDIIYNNIKVIMNHSIIAEIYTAVLEGAGYGLFYLFLLFVAIRAFAKTTKLVKTCSYFGYFSLLSMVICICLDIYNNTVTFIYSVLPTYTFVPVFVIALIFANIARSRQEIKKM